MNLRGGVTRFLRMNQHTQERYELSAQDGYEAYGRTTDFKNVGFVAQNLEDCKRMAIAFADAVR